MEKLELNMDVFLSVVAYNSLSNLKSASAKHMEKAALGSDS